jgi:hypothetical protein
MWDPKRGTLICEDGDRDEFIPVKLKGTWMGNEFRGTMRDHSTMWEIDTPWVLIESEREMCSWAISKYFGD